MSEHDTPENSKDQKVDWDEPSWQPSDDELGPREWTGMLPQEDSDVDWSEFDDGEVEKLSFEGEAPKTGNKKKAASKNPPLFSEQSLSALDSSDEGKNESQQNDAQEASVPSPSGLDASNDTDKEDNSDTKPKELNSLLVSEEALAQEISNLEEEVSFPQEFEDPAPIDESDGKRGVTTNKPDNNAKEHVNIFSDFEDGDILPQEDNIPLFTTTKTGEENWDITSDSLEPAAPLFEIKQKIEAILFATPKPIKIPEIAEVLLDEAPKARALRKVIEEIKTDYKNMSRGFELIEEHDAFEFRTRTEASELMERMFSNRPRPLSRAAQETLAIIAYRQPVTRADIEFIRGVDAGSIIKNLLERDFIKCVGRREISGRPMLFGTTEEFLKIYQLKTLDDLPPLASFQPNYDTKEALKSLNLDEEIDITEFVDNQVEKESVLPSEEVAETDSPENDLSI